MCRRCGTQIVALANALISHNPGPNQVLLPRQGNPQGEVRIVQWSELAVEIEGIAEYIASSIQHAKASAGQILILSPRRQIGYAIRDALISRGIPAHSFFHEEALEGNPRKVGEHNAQEAFTLLALLADPYDRVALRGWLGFGIQQLRSNTWQRIRDYCENNGTEPFDLLADMTAGNIKIAYTNTLLPRFSELRRQLDLLADVKGDDLMQALFPANAHWAQAFRSAILETLDENAEPREILDGLKTFITQPELPTDVDYVRIMSLHKSKGLTADLVVIAGCIEGLLPFIPNDVTPQERDHIIEEQRRLFYVAITRAVRTLVISNAGTLPLELAHKMGARIGGYLRDNRTRSIASSFIDELGPTRPETITGEALQRTLEDDD